MRMSDQRSTSDWDRPEVREAHFWAYVAQVRQNLMDHHPQDVAEWDALVEELRR